MLNFQWAQCLKKVESFSKQLTHNEVYFWRYERELPETEFFYNIGTPYPAELLELIMTVFKARKGKHSKDRY